VARIVLGVGGSIAAYKAADLCSKYVQAGHEVDVVLTRMAMRFVRPLSFSGLTQRRVHTDEGWGEGDAPAAHLHATAKAQALVVAPCTADLLGKFANGIADDILSTTYLGAPCPVLLAPAMNHRMWRHPRVVANVSRVKEDGATVLEPPEGWLAEGETGAGRMTEPEDVLAATERLLAGGGAKRGIAKKRGR
jgi:phosphopantothenoylcysteine decarboxylase/phosphopantothenate--cysteine ligase